jgi:ADP-ribose pyrophosphatase YjhB (NUDIX family)
MRHRIHSDTGWIARGYLRVTLYYHLCTGASMKRSLETDPGHRRIKRSVALAIRSPDGGRVLLVRRPADDAELPGVWGLPAASLAEGERWESAALRAAREKLGIEVRVGPELRRGEQPRATYLLRMRLHEAWIEQGEPHAPQPSPGVTQYDAWRWGATEEVLPAAERGSLCARLMLQTERDPGEPPLPAPIDGRGR